MPLIEHILDLAATPADQLPPDIRAVARLSLFDWMACGIGGQHEPVAERVRQHVAQQHGAGVAAVFGGTPGSALGAALANGTISHAMDYDDTHFAHIGHLSAAIYPAALATGQSADASLDAAVDGFLVGAECAIRIGLALGSDHYERGFHQTATAGAFGATVAAARMTGLSRRETRMALGLCATRASGLKNQFGTMGKPLNAGFAASSGVECAALAALGVTSADDGLEGAQGFIETHTRAPGTPSEPGRWLFEDIRYKLHACCHGTHAMIEALLTAIRAHELSPDVIESIQISVHPKWLRVCDIKRPRSGLEVKFSTVWLAAMVLRQMATADPAIYTDALCHDAELAALAGRVAVTGDSQLADTAADVALVVPGRAPISARHDLMDRIDPDVLRDRLQNKAAALVGDQSGAIWQHIHDHGNQSSRLLQTLMSCRCESGGTMAAAAHLN